MRIALLTAEYVPYPGGVATYCREMVIAARQLGHDVTVLAPDYGGADPGLSDEIDIVRYPGGLFKLGPRTLLELVGHVLRLLRARRFDIVLAADWPMIMALALIPRKGERRIATIYGTDVLALYHGRRARLLGSRHALRKFDRYAGISAFSAGLLARYFPRIAPDKIMSAPLGVGEDWLGLDYVRPVGERGADPFTLLTVARIDARKGHLAMVEAIGLLPSDLGPVRYVCIGRKVDEALFNAIEQRARELGVDFVYRGILPRDELVDSYRRADLFVLAAQDHPRDVEGFGLVLLEAASQGLPALVTPVHAIPEVVVDGVTGWVARSASPRDVADRLSEIILDRENIADKIDDCIAHARSFTWIACVKSTFDV